MPTPAVQTQKDITSQAQGAAGGAAAQSAEDKARSNALIKPYTDFNTAAGSMDPGAVTTAAAPFIENIGKGVTATREQIMNTMPPGAGRDAALARLEESKGSQTAGFLNQAAMQGLQQNAQIGAGFGSSALQYLGADISGLNTASSSNQAVLQAEEAKWSSIMSLMGQVAGAGGMLGMGAFMKPKV